jgi:hypothetical protein
LIDETQPTEELEFSAGAVRPGSPGFKFIIQEKLQFMGATSDFRDFFSGDSTR